MSGSEGHTKYEVLDTMCHKCVKKPIYKEGYFHAL
jgi:hypothetical protein